MPARKRGWCTAHYDRWRRHRDLNESVPVHGSPPEQRYWMYVVKGAACWAWTGAKDGDGYGMLKVDGRMQRAHRFSFELHHRPLVAGEVVCHRCDNPECSNPDHLFAGTQADNNRDMAAKGRALRGERNHQSKLDTDDVRTIRRLRRDGLSYRAIADHFNIDHSNVGLIITGKSWGWVDERAALVAESDQ
jgi:hypothetical protein